MFSEQTFHDIRYSVFIIPGPTVDDHYAKCSIHYDDLSFFTSNFFFTFAKNLSKTCLKYRRLIVLFQRINISITVSSKSKTKPHVRRSGCKNNNSRTNGRIPMIHNCTCNSLRTDTNVEVNRKFRVEQLLVIAVIDGSAWESNNC